jgi:hypothetical protein
MRAVYYFVKLASTNQTTMCHNPEDHNIVTKMTTDRQRLAKHVPKGYPVNKNRRPLLDNGLGEHAFPWQRFGKHIGYCETDPRSRDNGYADYNRRIHKLLDWVFCIRFARRYKRKAVCQTNQRVSEFVNDVIRKTAAKELISQAQWTRRRSWFRRNGTSLRQSPIVSCCDCN